MLARWLRRWTGKIDREWLAAVADCLSAQPAFFPAIHPERDVPYLRLQLLTAAIAVDADDPTDVGVTSLRKLVATGRTAAADVPIAAISGIDHMKGDYSFDLARAPETMNLLPHETFGPLNPAEMDHLWKVIQRELGGFDEDGRLRLTHQIWDNRYVVHNSGASRRFALWWRLQHYVDPRDHTPRPALSIATAVTTVSLEPSAMDYLTTKSRVVFCKHDPAIKASMDRLRELDPAFNYVVPGRGQYRVDEQRPAAIFIPWKGSRRRGLADLHRWADHLFDLGRYLAERSSTYRI